MIQFNLLPDVKITYLKTQRTKRMVVLLSMIVAGVSLAAVTVLFISVQVVQKRELNKVTEDIKKESNKLTSVNDLNKILTIQNQLSALPQLHQNKPVSSRLFGYLEKLIPAEAGGNTTRVTVSTLEINMTDNTISLSGAASDLLAVNKFADSLKFATYKNEQTQEGKPFTNVVTTLGKDGGKTTYTIAASFDPALFANFSTVELIVPQKVTNRSVTERPTLFKAETPPKKEGN